MKRCRNRNSTWDTNHLVCLCRLEQTSKGVWPGGTKICFRPCLHVVYISILPKKKKNHRKGELKSENGNTDVLLLHITVTSTEEFCAKLSMQHGVFPSAEHLGQQISHKYNLDVLLGCSKSVSSCALPWWLVCYFRGYTSILKAA